MLPAPREPGKGRSEAPGSEVLQGTIERVTFADARSLYAVLKLTPERGYGDPEARAAGRGQATAVGLLEGPRAGERVRLTGGWRTHPTHGHQFEFELCERLEPADALGVVRYLASPVFSGIGAVRARRIVETLGPGALEIIREDPERLSEVKGLGAKARRGLVATLGQEFAQHRLQAFLRTIGLGPRQSAVVVRHFGPDGEARLRADPYLLAGAVPGIGFGIADRIASTLGLGASSPERCRAGVLNVLRTAANEGHTLLPQPKLIAGARELLGGAVADQDLAQALGELERTERVRVDRDLPGPAVYLPWLAASERGLARNLVELLSAGDSRAWADAAVLARAEQDTGIELDLDQRQAVLGILACPLALLTGGPGVGKTTIVRLVVALAEADGARVRLASPTGRAAKRLAEATGRPAATLHRLLAFDPRSGQFAHDGRRPLEADLVVVDEISMLDVVLAHHLFEAVRAPARVLLVGDPDQLPAVGPGNVLGDLLASGRIPVFRLTRIHRQERGSLIVANAHRILAGLAPELPARGDTSADFYFFRADEERSCAERVVEVVTRRIPARFGLDWVEGVQVLAPMYAGECGVDALNARLRAALGSVGAELRAGDRTWREGDRVIHTRNDYDKEVFNGDMGRIVAVSEDGLRVAFPEREVAYGRDELGDLQPAFAVTVHRAQGSEYPAVVIPLSTRHRMMLQRNLLYTAVTRAVRLAVLVGSRRALGMALGNAEQGRRLSALAERLRLSTPPRS